MARKITYGDIPRQRTKYLLEALLRYANYELEDCDNLPLKFNWINEKELKIQGELNTLELLTEKCGQRLSSWQIRDALSEYLNEKFLGILEDHRLNKQGKIRSFKLTLWHRGYDISSNLSVFDQEWQKKSYSQSVQPSSPALPLASPSLETVTSHNYQVNLQDYVERPPLEKNCLNVLKQEQSLLRIRAPYHSGKTRLVDWLITELEKDNYQPIIIDCEEEKTTINLTTEDFLFAICHTITQELNLKEATLDKFWKRTGTPAHKARRYLEEYILKPSKNPLIFVFEKFDTILETNNLGNEICGILRSWHEKRSQPWRKLRLVIVHSTEFYANYDFYSSPLMGVGSVASLSDFDQNQVLTLAKLNQINWTLPTVETVMNLVGGNPYLVKLIITKIQEEIPLETIFEDAIQGRDPFQSHFRLLIHYLQNNDILIPTFQQILHKKTLTSAQLKGESVQFLERLGLITRKADRVEIRCHLYQLYFQDLFN